MHSFLNETKFYINLQLLELEESMLFSPKQGLASIKVFFPTPLNNKLCPYPKTLTACPARLCEGIGQTLRKDDSYKSLWSST